MARKIYTSEEITKKMDALPEAAADFLYSSEMNGIVKGIADKHSLHIDQMGLLEAETGQLILGLTEPQDFAPYITESLKISTEQATSIAKDINEQVMSKIRASMGQPSGTEMPVAASPVSKPAPVTPVPTMDTPTPSVVMPSSFKPEVSPVSAPTPSIPPTPASAAAPKPPATPAPVSIVTPAPAPSAAPAPKPAAIAPNLGAAEAILSEKKVTPPAPAPISAASAPASTAPATSPAAKVDPTQPQPYKADPYREPVE